MLLVTVDDGVVGGSTSVGDDDLQAHQEQLPAPTGRLLLCELFEAKGKVCCTS